MLGRGPAGFWPQCHRHCDDCWVPLILYKVGIMLQPHGGRVRDQGGPMGGKVPPREGWSPRVGAGDHPDHCWSEALGESQLLYRPEPSQEASVCGLLSPTQQRGRCLPRGALLTWPGTFTSYVRPWVHSGSLLRGLGHQGQALAPHQAWAAGMGWGLPSLQESRLACWCHGCWWKT